MKDHSENEDLLRRVYDPAYVRRVGIERSAAPVQVCLDSRMIAVRGTGVATYATALARCLPRTGAAPMLLREPSGAEPASRPRRWIAALDGRRPRVAAHGTGVSADGGDIVHDLVRADVFREAQVFFNLHRRLMPVVTEAPPPVMHWTYPVPLYFEGALNVYTVHDVIPLTRPDLTPIRQPRHRDLLARIAERAHRIVTVSDSARAEIAAVMATEPERVVSLSQGIDIAIQSDPPLPAGLGAGGYFLFCGSLDPRKNIIATADAHARAGCPQPLAVVGPDGWRASEIRRRLADFPGTIVLPWQERPVLLGLIRRARALVLASLAEGFGLPIAEAMTLGTPVITADLPATAEVAGGASLLVDPLSVESIAQAFQQLAGDDKLAARLRTLGFARANHFTLDRYAVRLRDFYAGLALDAGLGGAREGEATA